MSECFSVVVGVEMTYLREVIYILLYSMLNQARNNVKNDHRSKFSNLSKWKEEKKNQEFQASSFQLLKFENLLR